MKGHTIAFPTGWRELLVVNFFSSFAYYGFRSIFLLYLIEGVKIYYGESLEIFSAFVSLHFITQVVSGWVSDQYLGNQRGIWLGGVLIFMGSVSLFFEMKFFLYFGIASFVIGSSFNHVNVIALMGKLLDRKDMYREASFTWLKVVSNFSLVLSILLIGSFVELFSWKWAFLICGGAGVLSSLSVYLYRTSFGFHGFRPSAESDLYKGASPLIQAVFYALIVGALVLATSFMLWKNQWLSVFVPIFAVISIMAALQVSLIKKIIPGMLLVFSLFIFNILYLSLFHYANSLWVLFVNSNVDRSLEGFLGKTLTFAIHHYREVPLVVMKAFNGIFVVLLGSVLAYLWKHLAHRQKNPDPVAKYALGFAFSAVSFAVLSISRSYASDEGLVSLWWFVLGLLLYTLGELLILPTALAYLTKVVPKENMGLLVGVWLMSGSLSVYVNRVLSNVLPDIAPTYDGLASLKQYCDAFGALSWMCFFLAVLAFMFIPFTRNVVKR